MELINDLGTDLALAILAEPRYRQKIDPARARALIERVRRLLESSPAVELGHADAIQVDQGRTLSAPS